MPGARVERAANRLIDRLPGADRDRILQETMIVELPFGSTLCEAGEMLDHVYFPLSGFISLIAALSPREALEAGLVGNEGMLGGSLAWGIGVSPVRGVVWGEGSALRMTAVQMRRALCDSPALQRVLNQYLCVRMAQLLRTSLCTHYHEISPRLARCLLMTQDRANADEFRLTHELLASMLGVRRSGVTVAAGALQRSKLIRYARGRIRILDRNGLAAMSCACYAGLLDDYSALLA